MATRVAARIMVWVALGIAGAALALWAFDVIGPPSGIVAGAAAILVLLAAGRRSPAR